MPALEFGFPVDGAALVAGAAIAVAAVRAEDGVKRPVVKHLGWHRSSEPNSYWGRFYYFRFVVRGRLLPDWAHDPGPSRIALSWRDQATYAKWNEFARARMVRPEGGLPVSAVDGAIDVLSPLTTGVEYSVPLLARRPTGEVWIYSGWAYGADHDYGPDPRVRPSDILQLDFQGAGGLRWRRHVQIATILLAEKAGRLPLISTEPDDYR